MTMKAAGQNGDWMRSVRIACALVACSWLASCASLPSIATDVEFCCSPAGAEIDNYRIEFVETPEFLKPMLRDEAAIVLAVKGLEYTEVPGEGDAVLTMTFINRTLESGEAARDEAWETIAPGGGVRFIAEVRLEMKRVSDGETIISGTMGRVHNVYEGSYMHDAPGRAAMRGAFLALFSDFPAGSSD